MKVLLISLMVIQVVLIIIGINQIILGYLPSGIFGVVLNSLFLPLNIQTFKRHSNEKR
jgi:hypothetical protein